jgi:hypothetical protein
MDPGTKTQISNAESFYFPLTSAVPHSREISGSVHGVGEGFALLECYAAMVGS